MIEHFNTIHKLYLHYYHHNRYVPHAHGFALRRVLLFWFIFWNKQNFIYRKLKTTLYSYILRLQLITADATVFFVNGTILVHISSNKSHAIKIITTHDHKCSNIKVSTINPPPTPLQLQFNPIAYTFIIYPYHIWCKIKRRLVWRLNPGFYSHIAAGYPKAVF